MHIGVFGGTFNPIHYGHLRTAKRVTRTYSLDLCLLMVAEQPSRQEYAVWHTALTAL